MLGGRIAYHVDLNLLSSRHIGKNIPECHRASITAASRANRILGAICPAALNTLTESGIKPSANHQGVYLSLLQIRECFIETGDSAPLFAGHGSN